MKRVLSVLVTMCLLLCCTRLALAKDGSWEFTDSLGRTVTLENAPETVVPTGILTQIVLLSLCPDRMCGLAEAWGEEAQAFIPEKCLSLPVLGQLYGSHDALNPESLLQTAPDLIIDIGEAKQGIAEDLDTLSEQVGISIVHIDATLATMGESYRMLGDLLGLQSEAATLAAYCESTYAEMCALADSVEKRSIVYLSGIEGLHVIARGSYHAEIIDIMGENVAEVEVPSSKGTGNETDIEQLMLWNPDVIVFAPGTVYEQVAEDTEFSVLRAVASNHYYEAPQGPFNWLGFPPSVQRLPGMLWLGKLLYPETAQYDLYERTCEYYELFYHCELTPEQYEALMRNSLGKEDA